MFGDTVSVEVEAKKEATTDRRCASAAWTTAATTSVVEDHIENDLDSRSMQRLYHIAKLVHWAKPISA